MAAKSITEISQGVFIDPVSVTRGDEVKIKYQGRLAGSGNSKVFLHIGYGQDHWHDIQDIPMKKTRGGGWSTTFTVSGAGLLNFCFRDDTGNWDNHLGQNWIISIN